MTRLINNVLAEDTAAREAMKLVGIHPEKCRVKVLNEASALLGLVPVARRALDLHYKYLVVDNTTVSELEASARAMRATVRALRRRGDVKDHVTEVWEASQRCPLCPVVGIVTLVARHPGFEALKPYAEAYLSRTDGMEKTYATGVRRLVAKVLLGQKPGKEMSYLNNYRHGGVIRDAVAVLEKGGLA